MKLSQLSTIFWMMRPQNLLGKFTLYTNSFTCIMYSVLYLFQHKKLYPAIKKTWIIEIVEIDIICINNNKRGVSSTYRGLHCTKCKPIGI